MLPRDLDAMSDDELRAAYLEVAKTSTGSASFWLDELAHRRSARSERRLIWLTAVIALLTVANVVLVAYSILR